jgi:glycosyltransferase involved in cell wall biosynthesis
VEQAVDVVIRTAGQYERRSSLQRAIRSVLNQQDVVARPIVVLIGNLPRLAAELAAQHRVKVHRVGEPAPPGRALGIGRRLIEAGFYAFLDDDDELLPHALATGLKIMHVEPWVDLVVTTGYWFSGNRRQIHIPNIARHQDDAVNGIIERCWLSACGGLYRASTISQNYFEHLPDFCEWTCLAFRLALDRRNIRFLDLPTYNVYDSPGSQSQSDEYLEAALGVLAAMRAHPLPPEARDRLEQKYRAALHRAAEHYRQAKQWGKAWRFHLKSLKPPYTLRYAAYTRKLLWKRHNRTRQLA